MAFELFLIFSAFKNCDDLRNEFLDLLKRKLPNILSLYEKKIKPETIINAGEGL